MQTPDAAGEATGVSGAPVQLVDDDDATARIGFGGYGAAGFGQDAQALRQAWEGELEPMPPGAGDACHYLVPARQAGQGHPLAFMVEGGRLVRIDVAGEAHVAPGGGKVGMTAGQLQALYPDMQASPHKYVEGGRYLSVQERSDGASKLVFEVDAAGRVGSWRIGIAPQVDYVEGCG